MAKAKLDVIPLFYIPLVHIVLDEDTDELKTCNEYLTSAVQSDNVNIGNEYVENYLSNYESFFCLLLFFRLIFFFINSSFT